MFNLPNLLALLRVFIAPMMLWVILNQKFFINAGFDISWNYYFAALLFVLASVTDFFDGFIAREWKQTTLIGSIIDPLADKMLTIAAFLGLMMMGDASIWAIYIIIVREMFITALRTVAVGQNISVKASFTGKIKTVSQMLAIGFLIMHWPYATFLLWVAVFLTLYSGIQYIMDFKQAIMKEI